MSYRKSNFIKGHYYHIYNRGINKENIFYRKENYHYCLRLIKKNLLSFSISIIAYCLMPNHYHLLLRQDTDRSISEFIRNTFISYVQALNLQVGRSGPLFQGRFKAIHIDNESYIIHLCRYIHLNPVYAGLVKQPEDWPFSNYPEWIDIREGNLVDRQFIGERFKNPSDYKEFIEDSGMDKRIHSNLERYILE